MLPVLINSSIICALPCACCACACSSLICCALALVHLGGNCTVLSLGGPVFFLGLPLPRFESAGKAGAFGICFLFTSTQGCSGGCVSMMGRFSGCGAGCGSGCGCSGSGFVAMNGFTLLTLMLISLRSILMRMFPLSLTLVMTNGPDHLAANFLFLLRKLRSSNQICCPTL